MKGFLYVISVACVAGILSGCPSAENRSETGASPTSAPEGGKATIGVYDSRMIAIAFAGSEMHEKSLAGEHAAYEKAKAENDSAAMKRVEATMQAAQKLMHRQGFGTASVDNILAYYPEALQSLSESHQVKAILSKWDETALERYPDADRVDLTDALIDMIQPTERQRRAAESIRDKKPLTDAELEQAHD